MKGLIIAALRRPITVMVALIAVVLFAALALRTMPIDIFPKLNTPTVYVAQPFGGLSPQQMEGFITSYYEYHFLYVTGIKFVESKSIQGVALMKLQFHEGTDMSQALAEVLGYVNRSRAFMPPGTVPPFVMRFDGGSVPVGQLVFKSETRSLGEIQDLALFKVRPMFSTLPGVSAPPPFGGNQRTVVIRVDTERLRTYNLSPDDVVQALAKNNTITPAGNVRVDDQLLITPQNTVVENIKELETIALKHDGSTTVCVRDVATVENGADVTTGYALINGKRSIYIPVTKRADASTWEVVQTVKKALPAMQAAVPPDIQISYEFDQSGYVINSLRSLLTEAALGALLTGLMVLLFLHDRRSAAIVVCTIPLAVLAGVICLYLAGQTINIMTLGGLALAVGILVDEATVTIENIHRHLEMTSEASGETKKSRARAVADACQEIALPKLLILLSILVVFVPSLFMSGVPRAMFVPLSLAVGFSMIASFVLSQTFVPVVATWFLRDTASKTTSAHNDWFERFRTLYARRLEGWLRERTIRRLILTLYAVLAVCLLAFGAWFIGTEIFPTVDAGQFQVRLRMPTGTRIERTESATQDILRLTEEIVGKQNVEISSAFVGTQPSSYPINTIHLWTSGPHEAVLKVKFKAGSGIRLKDFKERLRSEAAQRLPAVRLSFEPGDMVEQVMNFGATTPIEVAVVGKDLAQSRSIAENLRAVLTAMPHLRDVQFGSPLDYPSLNIAIDRTRTGQMGLTVDDISKSLVTATSSSRFTQPNYWLDRATGTAYQVQVEVPQFQMHSVADVEEIPLSPKINDKTPDKTNDKSSTTTKRLALRDVAEWNSTTTVGEYDRLNQQRYVTVTANIHGQDVGSAVRAVRGAVEKLGTLPAGVKIMLRGQADVLAQTLSELQIGLALAIVVMFLLLAANFQSFRLASVILATVPAVLCGSLTLLVITGKTLNIQSFMGCIMAIGVSVANGILLVTNAESLRKYQTLTSAPTSNRDAALHGTLNRLRPILMTALAMIAGMIPMAIGVGDGGDQTSPLGVAVIGGLLFSTMTTLVVSPVLYAAVLGAAAPRSVSLDPDDEESAYFGQ